MIDPTTVQVGDLVCDCRYRHLKVAEVRRIYAQTLGWYWLDRIVLWYWFPDSVRSKIWQHWPWKEIVDANLVLEDGAGCSAVHCCDPVDHDESDHPPKGE